MKFFKWFFLGLGFWIILIMLISYPINTRAGAVSSVTLSDKDVTFYSPNGREVIYSLNVPYGQSLNDLTSSYLNTNTSFSRNYSGFNIAPASFWSSTTFTYDDYAGLTLKNNIEFSYMNMWVNLPSSSYVNLDNIYVHFLFDELSDGFNMQQVYAVSRSGSDNHYYTKNYLQTGSYTIVKLSNLNYPDYSSMDIGFQFVGSNLNVSLKYFVVTADPNFSYFNDNYLKQLYFNAGYDISNLSWSESPYTSIPFSYNDPIEFNTNLYPSKVTEFFSLTDSWQSLLTGLDKNYMTFNTFQDLVETFQDLIDPNNLKVDNFIDVFKALWFLLKSVFVLLYNVLMLIIAPFVDLFRMLISALFSGLDFWILI